MRRLNGQSARQFVLVLMIVASVRAAGGAVAQTPNNADLAVLFLTDTAVLPGQVGRGLPTPAGTTIVPRTTSSSSSLDYYQTAARLAPSAPLADVAAHYQQAIAARGWKLVDRAADANRVAVSRFQGASSSGEPVTAMLVAMSLAAAGIDLDLRLVRTKSAMPAAQPASAGANPSAAARRRGAGASAQSVPGVPAELLDILYEGAVAAPGESFSARAGTAREFPIELLPAGTKVAASVVSKSIVSVVGEVPGFSMSRVPGHLISLNGKSWTEPRPSSVPSLWPFRRHGLELCRGDSVARLLFIPRSGADVVVTGSILSAAIDPNKTCGGARRPGPPREWGVTIALPLLLSPPGVTIASSGGAGGGLTTVHTQRRMNSPVPLAALMGDYVSQMAAAKWKLEGQIDRSTIAVARFASTSTTGEPVITTLTLSSQSSASDVDAWIRVLRPAASIK